MARPASDARPQLSVFDRLLDDQPRNRQEVQPTRLQANRQYREAVARDLESLLNARANPWVPDSKEFPQLKESVYTFGLPDFSTLTVRSTEDRRKLTDRIRTAIAQHECRLTNVEVAISNDATDAMNMQMRFVVSALLLMDPAPEQVTFDTVLELSRGEYEVKGD